MGLGEMLGSAYVKVEDTYYGILDFFEDKGIRLPWAYNDFLEKKGIPALPITIGILLILAGGFFLAVQSTTTTDFSFSVHLKDQTGRSLQDVTLQIFDETGALLRSTTVSDGGIVTLSGIRPNSVLSLNAQKQGYGDAKSNLLEGSEVVSLKLQGTNEAIIGKLRIIDGENQTTITSVLVTASWKGAVSPLVVSPDAEGIVSLNVPLNQEVSLTIKADNYEDLIDVVTFTGGDVRVKQLFPKASASSGPSVLYVKAIDAGTQLPLENIFVTVENAQTGDVLGEGESASGLFSLTLNKGQVIRVTVKKDGYVSYSSNVTYAGGKTLRNEEETIIANLENGGADLHVLSYNNSSQQPLQGAIFTLLDEHDEKIEDQTSNFSGEAFFAGLNQENVYTLLAYHPNFFPERIPVVWPELENTTGGKQLSAFLSPFSTSEAGIITVFVNDADGKIATLATVSVDEKTDDGLFVPLVSSKPVDVAGSFTVRVPVGKTIRINGEKDGTFVSEEVTVVQGLNKVILTLDSASDKIVFTLKNPDLSSFEGKVTITSGVGGILFNGTTLLGEISFYAGANDTVHLVATSANGDTFSQTISIGGRNPLDVVLGVDTVADGEIPSIDFLGYYSPNGEPVAGLSPEEDVFARYAIQWPTNAKTGTFFVRAGPDELSVIDSQFFGIIGVNTAADTINYGTTWSPAPAPGNENKDRHRVGKAGSFSKWVEVVQNNPAGGQSIVDIRLRARENIPAGNQSLFVRAETRENGVITRYPADAQLGSASFTETKSGLYANAIETTLPVYETQPHCENGICASLTFVDKDNRSFSAGGFSAQRGQPYAVQVVLLSGVDTTKTVGEGLVPLSGTTNAIGTNTVSATTSPSDPILFFTKAENSTFGKIEDNGSRETSVQTTLSTSANGSRARFQFIPTESGETTVDVRIVTNAGIWNDTLAVNIVEPRVLQISFPQIVRVGEYFTISVRDETGNPVGDALITLSDASGKKVLSLKGRNAPDNGENGLYKIDRSLDAGFYDLTVSASNHVLFEDGLRIGDNDPLTVDTTPFEISIPFGKTTITKTLAVTNHTNQSIENISAEFLSFESFPKEISLNFGQILLIPPNGKGTIEVTATYTGDEASTSPLLGAGKISLRGEAAQRFPIVASVQANVTYNKQLDSTCLSFSKDRLVVTLSGETQPYGNLYNNQTVNGSVPYYGYNAPVNGYDAYNTYNSSGYNAYGYNNSGYYQNEESKRVNVTLKNNCGTDLDIIPSIGSLDGQTTIDGLKIAAVDSSLKLSNGEQKQVDFLVTNQLFHANYGGTPIQYAATFSSPQVFATLPIDVAFWDRSRTLSTPESITLQLIKSQNQKATDRVSVPITNIGAGPIYNIQATLEGEKSSQVTIKLENGTSSSGGSSTNYSTSYSNALNPGETRYPPLAIVGESLSDETGLVTQQLVITGIIDGRRTELKRINVYAQTGNTSCLEISAFNTPVTFVSAEIGGTIAKRVSVKNNCLEPLRVTQLQPSSTGGTNNLVINPADGLETLEKDVEKEYTLTLNKGVPFKGNIPITLSGILLLSQKVVQSNPLTLEIKLGPNELESENASNPVEVPICEGGTTTVRFPILAKKNECNQAYCDAEQGAQYLSTLIEQQVAKVVQQLQAKKNDVGQFSSCQGGNGYCTFSQLGISSPTAELFLQHDVLSPSALEYVMRGGTFPRLTRMQAELLPSLVGETADTVLATRLGTGLGNKVFLPAFTGCGKYAIRITGGVEVVAGQLDPDRMNVGIAFVSDKQATSECQDKIYNAANFLPKDKLFSATSNKNTLLGMVTYDAGLQTQAGWLAETVFGDADRAVNQTGSNTLELRTGDLTQSVVNLTLDSSAGGEQPKHITATVRQTNGTIPREIITEAGKIITSLGKTVNGCITQDEKTWKIYSVKDVGQFSFEGCMLPGTGDGGLVVRSNLACCSLTVKSDIQSEASFSLDPNGNYPVNGLVSLNLYEEDAQKIANETFTNPGSVIQYGSPYPLAYDEKERVYKKDVLLCGQSDAVTQQQVNGLNAQLFATRALDDTKAGPVAVAIQSCSLDADDAIAAVNKKGPGTYYATLDWKDNASQKTLVNVMQEIQNGDKTGNAYFTNQGQGIFANDNPVYREKFQEKQVTALSGFAATCALACGVCSAAGLGVSSGLGWAAFGKSFVGDCLLGCGIGAGAGAYEIYKSDADNTILETPRDIAETVYGIPRDATESLLNVDPANTPAFSAVVASTSVGLTRGIISTKEGLKKVADTSKKTAEATKKAKEAFEKLADEADAVGEQTAALADAEAELKQALQTAEDELTRAQTLANRARLQPTNAAALTQEASEARQLATQARLRAGEIELSLPAKRVALQNTKLSLDTVAAEYAALETEASRLIVEEQRLVTAGLDVIAPPAVLLETDSLLRETDEVLPAFRDEWGDLLDNYRNGLVSDTEFATRKTIVQQNIDNSLNRISGIISENNSRVKAFSATQGLDAEAFAFYNGTIGDIEKIREEYGTFLTNNQKLAGKINFRNQRLSRLTEDMVKKQAQVNEAAAEIFVPGVDDVASSELTSTRVQLDEARAKLEELKSSRATAQLEFTTAQKEYDTLQSSIREAEIIVNNRQQNLLDIQQSAGSNNAAVQQATADLAEAEAKIASLKEKIPKIQEKLNASTKDLSAAQALEESKNVELEKAAKELDKRTGELSTAATKTKLEEVNGLLSSNQTEYEQLVRRREALDSAITNPGTSAAERAAKEAERQSVLGQLAQNRNQFDELSDGLIEAEKLASDAVKAAEAKVPSTLKPKVKEIGKGLAKGLICGGIGNAAGYYAYKSNLTDEVDNRVSLETGSDAVLDAQTGELVFLKGQTYKFTVNPINGNTTSKTLTIDIVSPDTRVNEAAWLECDG